MRKETTITLDEWMQASLTQLPSKPKNSFTIKEACEKFGMNRRTITTRLEVMVAEGKLVKGNCFENGRICNYYIPTEFVKKK